MKYKLYARENLAIDKVDLPSLDKAQIKLMKKLISDMKNEYKEKTKNDDPLSMSKEETDKRANELIRYKETLDILECRINKVKKFISENSDTIEVITNLKEFQGKTPVKLYFGDKSYNVSNFANVLVTVSEEMSKMNIFKFSQVCETIKGKKRQYFSKNIEDLYSGKEIKGTLYFVETNNSSDINIGIAIELLKEMDFDKDVVIEVK